MPSLQVTYPAGALDPAAIDGLAEDLTATFLKWEGAPDNDFFRSNCWVCFLEVPPGAVMRGGVPTASPIYRVEATVPAGAMSPRRKEGLVREVTDLLLGAEDGDRDPLRVWVLINDVPNGNWGAAGQIIDFEQLREAARATRETAASS